jgi:hypothetical protein
MERDGTSLWSSERLPIWGAVLAEMVVWIMQGEVIAAIAGGIAGAVTGGIASVLIDKFKSAYPLYERRYAEVVEKLLKYKDLMDIEQAVEVVDEINLPDNLRSRWGFYKRVKQGDKGSFLPKSVEEAKTQFVQEVYDTNRDYIAHHMLYLRIKGKLTKQAVTFSMCFVCGLVTILTAMFIFQNLIPITGIWICLILFSATSVWIYTKFRSGLKEFIPFGCDTFIALLICGWFESYSFQEGGTSFSIAALIICIAGLVMYIVEKKKKSFNSDNNEQKD